MGHAAPRRAGRRTPSRQTQAAREHLAFSYADDTVAGRGHVEAALARDAPPTFATATFAEPRDWGYGGLMAFTAVLLLRPQDTLPFLEPLHLAEVCAIVGIAPMLLHRFAGRQSVLRITVETAALLALGAVMLATTPFSIWPGGAFEVFIAAFVKIVLVFILMMNTLTTPKRIERLAWLIVLCCGYVAIRAVIDYGLGENLIENERLSGPVGGIFGNPNDLALNMVTFLPAAALFAMGTRYSSGQRLTATIVGFLMLAVVVMTKSRGGLIGFIVMLIALVVLGRRIRPGLGPVILGAVLLSVPFMPHSFWDRMASIVDERQDKEQYTGSREARRILLQEGIDTFLERPLTGVGAGQFVNYNPPHRQERWREAHNVVVQVAADLGIFGLGAFLFLLFRAGVIAARTRRMLMGPKRARAPDPLDGVLPADDRDRLYVMTTAMSAGLVGWFACALFASVAYSWTFYYPLAIVVAAHEMIRDRTAGQKRSGAAA